MTKKWTTENAQFCWIVRGPNGEEYTMTGSAQVEEITAKLNELEDLREAATNLREAQKAYMADRGNESKGRAVGEAAVVLDEALGND